MSTDRPSLREELGHGRRMLGTFSLIPAPDVIELIGLAGFDLVIVDMEHGPHHVDGLRPCLLAAHAHGMHAVVRVRAIDPSLVGAALDLGADGVLVPQVGSAEQARTVVSAARFAPDGSRGANPWVSAAGFGQTPDWFARANREVAAMVMIEGVDGLAAAPDILAVRGLDAVFLGPVDMAHSLGVPGQIDHPRVVEALQGVVGRAQAGGLATGVFAPDPAGAQRWWSHGVQFVACGVDSGLIRTAFEKVVTSARAQASRRISAG